MPITLNCPNCHKPFRVRDESIGGRVRCPSCGTVLQVPSALSPVSHFDEPPKTDLPSSGGSGAQRPLAEDVRGRSHMGTDIPDLPLGGPGRRDEEVTFSMPPASAAAGPPSIKSKAPAAPPTALPRTSAAPDVPTRAPVEPLRPAPRPFVPGNPADDAWNKVRGGLGMIRCALFLCATLFVAVFGHSVWVLMTLENPFHEKPGLLKNANFPMWKEIALGYTAVLLAPAILLLLVGRLRCAAAPADSRSRGMALGATFFTVVAVLGFALYVGMAYFDLGDKLKIPGQVKFTALYAAIPSAILADILTLLFIGQIGWPIRRPSLQGSVAGFFIYTALLPAGILIGMQYFPVIEPVRESLRLHGTPLGTEDDNTAQRALIWGVIALMAGTLFFLRYAGVAGSARKGIRKLMSGEF